MTRQLQLPQHGLIKRAIYLEWSFCIRVSTTFFKILANSLKESVNYASFSTSDISFINFLNHSTFFSIYLALLIAASLMMYYWWGHCAYLPSHLSMFDHPSRSTSSTMKNILDVTAVLALYAAMVVEGRTHIRHRELRVHWCEGI